MISPEQTLLHLTSSGIRVRKKDGMAGSFINDTNQPLRNVNKFGLLHYSIPKTLDMLTYRNRMFRIRFEFMNGEDAIIDVPLPLMDYHKMTIDATHDDDRLDPNAACLTEVLQTSINWAIQSYERPRDPNRVTPPMPPPFEITGRGRLNRLGCIVRWADDGRLEFYFGYRGNLHTVTDEESKDETSQYNNIPPGDKVVKKFNKTFSGGPLKVGGKMNKRQEAFALLKKPEICGNIESTSLCVYKAPDEKISSGSAAILTGIAQKLDTRKRNVIIENIITEFKSQRERLPTAEEVMSEMDNKVSKEMIDKILEKHGDQDDTISPLNQVV